MNIYRFMNIQGSQMPLNFLAAFNFFSKYFFLLESNCQDHLAINSYLHLGYSHCNS